MPIEKTSHTSTPSRVMIDDTVAQLEALIMRGELKPGDRLPEQQLADTLGVSRGPLREAIRTDDGCWSACRTPAFALCNFRWMTWNNCWRCAKHWKAWHAGKLPSK